MSAESNLTLGILIDHDPEGFERAIICSTLDNPESCYHYLNMLCGAAIEGKTCHEFSSRYRNLIFLCIKQWNELVSSPTAISSLSWEIIAMLYKDQLISFPHLGSPQEEPLIQSEWEAIKNASPEMKVLCQQNAIFTFWLQRRRMEVLLRNLPKNPTKKLVEQLQQAISSASTNGKDLDRRKFDLIEFSDLDVTSHTEVKLMSSGEPELDRILDGGFYQGGSYMFLAPTGGGKTVFACQMALNAAALSNKNTLYITNEDKPRILKMRMCSNWCDIDYGKIVKPGRVNFDELRPNQQARFNALMEIINKKMDFVDWSTNALATRDLPLLMEKYRDKKGYDPDFVVFDWIGGATDKSNPMFYRLQYQQQADYMAEFADQTQSVVVFTAQASAAAYTKKIVSGEDAAENKTLQARCFGTLGLSALKRKDLGEETGIQNTYEERQYLSATKLRHGQGGTRAVLRDFKYQRLKFS